MNDDLVLAALLSSPTTALVGADPDGTVTLWSGGAQELLGWSEAQMLGRAIATIVPPDRRHELQIRERVAEGADLPPTQTVRLAADGSLVPLEVHVLPVRDGDSAVVGTVALYRDLRHERGALEDVTALREAEERLRTQAARFDALLETTPVAVFTFDGSGVCTTSRGRGLEGLGLDQDQLVGASLLDLARRDREVVAALTAALEGREARVSAEQAGRVWDAHYRPLRDPLGELAGGIGIALDVTDLVTAEREVRANVVRLEALLRHSGDVVLVVDESGRMLWVSPAVQGVLGLDPTDLLGSVASDLVHPDDVPVLAAAWPRVLQGRFEDYPPPCRLRCADGTWRWFDVHFTDLRGESAVNGVVINLRDQTERLMAEREVQRLGLHDALTGLPNRALLLDRVGQAMVWGAQQGRQSGLVVLGVTGMTGLNELLGSERGDLVLCSIAGRLLEVVRSTDSVARIGGDRFAVLVEDVSSTEELRTRAAMLLDAVQGPLELLGVAVDLRFRAGSAMTPASGAGSLVSAAERSMAESSSGDQAVVVARGRDSDGASSDAATQELGRAIERRELTLHFQPVMSLDDGSMVGAEALVRWQHPERGLLSPGEFVPLAEASALIVELGRWVLREVCVHAARWQAAGHAFGVGLNLSPRQMVDNSFIEDVRAVLRETGARAGGLVLEVTESAVMDVPTAAGVLGDLSALGIRLALDDFGTGYSSLTYLRRFPVDMLKIDRSFIAGLGRNADDDAIVASVASLGHRIGKIVVAEGVETISQVRALQTLGVHQAQGFYWSPALPADELIAWVEQEARSPLPAPRVAAPGGASHRARTGPVSADAPQILRLHGEGASLHTIAAALNAAGKRTAEGRRWTSTTVAKVVAAAVDS